MLCHHSPDDLTNFGCSQLQHKISLRQQQQFSCNTVFYRGISARQQAVISHPYALIGRWRSVIDKNRFRSDTALTVIHCCTTAGPMPMTSTLPVHDHGPATIASTTGKSTFTSPLSRCRQQIINKY